MSGKKIFVTGATGFIGRVVTELAVKEGHTVRGLSRREQGDALLQSLGATPVRGDLTNHALLSQESQNADIVLHLAYDHDFSKPYEQIIALENGAVDAMASALAGTEKPLVVTHGTAVVAPDPNGGETDETSPCAAAVVVPRHKAEEHALEWVARGVRVICIRLPQYVYGRGTKNGFATRLIRLAVGAGESVYIGDGGWNFSDVYVDDAARLYLLVAERGKAGEVFNASGKTTNTYKDLADAVGDLLEVPVRSITKEEAEKRWGAFLTRFFSIANRASSQKAKQELGWRPVGPELLWEIREGSYRAVAEAFRRDSGKI